MTFILTVYTYSVVKSKILYSGLKTTLRREIIHFNVLKTHGETTGKCIILPPHKLLLIIFLPLVTWLTKKTLWYYLQGLYNHHHNWIIAVSECVPLRSVMVWQSVSVMIPRPYIREPPGQCTVRVEVQGWWYMVLIGGAVRDGYLLWAFVQVRNFRADNADIWQIQ